MRVLRKTAGVVEPVGRVRPDLTGLTRPTGIIVQFAAQKITLAFGVHLELPEARVTCFTACNA